jgi:hypothetical protein
MTEVHSRAGGDRIEVDALVGLVWRTTHPDPVIRPPLGSPRSASIATRANNFLTAF